MQGEYYPRVSKSKFTQPDEAFRKLIRELRLAKNLTQAEVASRLGHPQSYVSKYETGERRLDFVETFLACEALDVSIEAFSAAFAKALTHGRRIKGR